MVNLEELNLEYNVSYLLKCGFTIDISHILVKDWNVLENCLELLKLYKNESEDPNVIGMTYLEYIRFLEINDKTNQISNMFNVLLANCIPIINGKFGGWDKHKNKLVYVITDENNNSLFYITSKDFEDIKQIILNQNFYNYDDTYLSPIIREAIIKQRKVESKGLTLPTLEKQKIYVMGKTGMSKNAIDNMTYRDFSQIYKMKVDEDIYFAKNIIKSGYHCTIDEYISHPLYQKEKGILDEILIDANSFKNKINDVTL